jgi:hypothetical protein
MLFILHEGAFLAHHHLYSWAALHGESRAANAHGRGLTIPALEAGLYTACRVPLSELAVLLASDEPPAHCVSGVLPPLGELILDLLG